MRPLALALGLALGATPALADHVGNPIDYTTRPVIVPEPAAVGFYVNPAVVGAALAIAAIFVLAED